MKPKAVVIKRPDCQWWLTEKCTLGIYGGSPQPIDCALCVSNRENTAEFAESLFARHNKTHPPTIRKISGCCDSALNPPTV
jgi:hypothetical protein